jgi:hypothetical protein
MLFLIFYLIKMSKSTSLSKSKDDDIKNSQKRSDSSNNSVKRKKSKKKLVKSKPSLLDVLMKKTQPIIIDDINKTKQFVFKFKKVIPPLNITVIYKKDKFHFSMNHKSTLNDLKEIITKKLNISLKKFEIFLNNSILKNDDNELIKELIKNSRFPIFEIKKKTKTFPFTSNLYLKKYPYKIIIDGINDLNDFKSQIDNFFEINLIYKDYICEYISEGQYLIGFNSQNIIFDFKRFLQILQIKNNLYKNIKSTIKYDSLHLIKNRLFSRKKDKRKIMFSPFINLTSPYITYEEIKRKEQLESKKKWICKDDFKSAVGNNSVDKYYMENYGYYL